MNANGNWRKSGIEAKARQAPRGGEVQEGFVFRPLRLSKTNPDSIAQAKAEKPSPHKRYTFDPAEDG